MEKKGSQHGKKRNSKSSWLRDLVTRRGSSSKKTKYVFTFPKTAKLGKVTYTVESRFDPITFSKRKDAVEFKRLLSSSVVGYESSIVRREITDEGFIL